MNTIGIIIWDHVEPLDFVGPYEVFNYASKFLRGTEEIKIFIIGVTEGEINAQGLVILPHYSLDNAPPLDMVLFPGGGVSGVIEDGRVIDWLRSRADDLTQIMSVCTGVFILAKTGLLHGSTITTHIGALDQLKSEQKKYGYRVVAEHRYHDNGKFVTSAGISAGIDMALHQVMKYWGEEIALRITRSMEYKWNREDVEREI